MIDAIERFINRQSDSDWSWGPLLYLRPLQTERMTLRFWLKLIGVTLLAAAPIGGVSGGFLVFYDYATAKHHDTKIPPIAATERWIVHSSPQLILSWGGLLIALSILGCVAQHWAWNRRADRLNREPDIVPPVFADAPGVWPPPPTVQRG